MTLVVGERFNNRRRHSWESMSDAQWYALALRLGAFPDVGRYDTLRLESLGLRVGPGVSMNLTPPDRQGVPFDHVRAARIGQLVVADARWPLVVCVGRSVATAFGVPTKWPLGELFEDRMIVIPHPSGRSRFWNDEIEVELLRDSLKETLCQANAQ